MEWYAGDDTYKPLNIQASAGVSLTVQHIRFFGGYAMGFSDLDKNEKTKTTTSSAAKLWNRLFFYPSP